MEGHRRTWKVVTRAVAMSTMMTAVTAMVRMAMMRTDIDRNKKGGKLDSTLFVLVS